MRTSNIIMNLPSNIYREPTGLHTLVNIGFLNLTATLATMCSKFSVWRYA